MVSSIDSKYFLCTDKTISGISENLSAKTSPMERILWEHTTGKAYEHTLPNAAKITPTEAAAGTGIMACLKKFWTLIMGEWGKPLGEAYRNAKKANPNLKITDFEWGKKYAEITAKQAAEKVATDGVKKSIFSKIGSKLGPILLIAFNIPRIIDGFKTGGLPEALKETAKAAIGLIGFAVGATIAAALGMTGVLAFVVPLLFSMVVDWGANKILGESKADEQAQLAQQQQQLQQLQQQINPAVPGTTSFGQDPLFQHIMQKDNPFATQYSQNPARTQYAF